MTGKRGRTRVKTGMSITRTLDRGLALLELLSEEREASLSRLARGVGITPTTASRLLETLKARGFVEQDATTGSFSVGMKAFQIGSSVLRARRIDQVAVSDMRALAEETGLPVSLGIRNGSSALYIERIETDTAVQIAVRLGRPMPLHATAIGKVLAAWLWSEALERALGPDPLTAFTDHTNAERSEVLRDLEAVRARGWATDDQEFQDELFCISVPIRDRAGDVIAGLSVSSVANRMRPAAIESLVAQLTATAATVSGRLGWKPSPLALRASANAFAD